jgi:hypothetical protein
VPVCDGQMRYREGKGRSHEFKVWNLHTKEILKLFCDTEELDNSFRLLTEMPVQPERFGCIHLGHFKIVFWPSIQNEQGHTD